MKKIVFLVAFVLCLVSAGYAQTAQVALNWTSVGDDSLTGTAWEYDLRWSLDSTLLVDSFALSNRVLLMPPPLTSGSLEHFVVTGLPYDRTLFFVIKVKDESENWSGQSNVLRWHSPDLTPPAAVRDLRVE